MQEIEHLLLIKPQKSPFDNYVASDLKLVDTPGVHIGRFFSTFSACDKWFNDLMI